jgi:translation elongation factor EF-G
MSEELRVDMKIVATISKIIHKSLLKLQEMGVKFNMAELAVAYTETVHEYLNDLEKQQKKDAEEKRKGMAM